MSSIRKRDGRPKPWEARWTDPDGRPRSQSFTRKIDAQRFLVTVETDMLRGSYVDPKAGAITFKAFAETWLAAQTFGESSREATAQRLKVHIYPTFGRMQLRTIKPSTVQAWLRGRQTTNAPAHVRVMLVNLSQVLSAAVEDRLIASNPCQSSSVRAPRVERGKVVPWTVEQVQAVIAQHPPRWRAIPTVAAGCGLRQGEVFGLAVGDVDFLGRWVHVRHQVKRVGGRLVLEPPKGGKERKVPLPSPVADALAAHIAAHPSGGLIFSGLRGGMVDRSPFNQYVWKPALERAGIEATRANGMHTLRHHYASVLLDAGESVRTLADYLGHADPGFTLRVYTHLMPAGEDRARKAIESAWRGPQMGQEAR